MIRVPARFAPLGEQGLVVELGDRIDPALNARVHRLARAIRDELAGEALEVVPSYRSLLVLFDPLRTERAWLARRVRALLDALEEELAAPPGRLVEIPVCYGGEHGPDLAAIASRAGLSVEEAVALHSSTEYLVHMLGFMPGFPYLGGMPERLATPRLAEPRARVPAGSVGIAGGQSGIYPVASPGGWRLVGRTPLRLFTPVLPRPFLLAPGDRVRFVPIADAAYGELERRAAGGEP